MAAKPVHNALAVDIKGVNSVPNTVVKGIEDEGDTMFFGIYNSLTLNTRYKFKFKFNSLFEWIVPVGTRTPHGPI